MKAKVRALTTRTLQQAADSIGAVLQSKKAHAALDIQRLRAVRELATLEDNQLHDGLTGIVFSKDRALQLHALLHSCAELAQHIPALHIIYRASSPAHAQSYLEAQEEIVRFLPQVQFTEESQKFKPVLLGVLSQIKTRQVFFLVDDIVFIKPIDFDVCVGINPQQEVLSLRLSPHLRRSYTAHMSQMPAALRPSAHHTELLRFSWFEQGNEWSYPWSVDGHILPTAEVKVMTRLGDFNAPNTYEGMLTTFNGLCAERGGLCFEESKILNIPFNRVQTEVHNLSGDVSPEFLLTQWQQGQMIDTRGWRQHQPRSPHEEHAVSFIPRALPKRPRHSTPKSKA
jgi:hypothetical protein